MSSAIASKKPIVKAKPVVLIVDDERDIVELVDDVLSRELNARVIHASSKSEAEKILETETVHLVIADSRLPDGDGAKLIDTLQARQPQARAIVISGYVSIDSSIAAFRKGAIDFLPKPFDAKQLVDRVSKAVKFQALAARTDKRLVRLKSAVKKLNNARRTVSKRVDLLCNDLVGAYGDLARQFEDVRVRENFRHTVDASNDLEQMLCHTMDWLLRQCGYTNIAIYLSGDDGNFELGAFMKYTIAGTKPITDAIRHGVLETVVRDDFIQWTDREAIELLTDAEMPHLKGQTVMGVNATYLGESLGTIILFRDGKSPFSAEDAAVARTIAPVFAHALTNLARKEDGGEKWVEEPGDDEQVWPEDSFDNTDNNYEDKPKRKKKDDADWWKRGEQPPF
ncbi:MAG TPA: response regulator [Tepidisphaeraceae bacterium]|nr:response regulator [Tepidisphaeraceae bacterium]